MVYQIQTDRPSYALRNAQVTVCEDATGQVTILYKAKRLNSPFSTSRSIRLKLSIPRSWIGSSSENPQPTNRPPITPGANRFSDRRSSRSKDVPTGGDISTLANKVTFLLWVDRVTSD